MTPDLIHTLSSMVYLLIEGGFGIALVVAFLDTTIGIGLLIPGSIILMFMGSLATIGVFDFYALAAGSISGGLLSDMLNYYLGKHHGLHWHRKHSRLLRLMDIEQRRLFIQSYGLKALLISRLLPGEKEKSAFIAGYTSTHFSYFILYDFGVIIAWVTITLLTGYYAAHAINLAELWLSRAGLFIPFAVSFLLLVFLLKVIAIRKGKQLLHQVHTLFHFLKIKITQNRRFKLLAKNHPTLVLFINNRIDKSVFNGRPLSILMIALLYIMALFAGIIEDFITADAIVMADIRIANLFTLFRNETLTSFFTWITLLGKLEIISIVLVISAALLYLWNKKHFIIPFFISALGSLAFTWSGKLAFQRARPEYAIYLENSYSFPSGHAAIAVAIYGFIGYLLIRSVTEWPHKVNIFVVTIAVVLLIGFSRVYLGVHYISDIWCGYLVGAIWLIIGITLSEWLKTITSSQRVRLSSGKLISATCFLLSVVILFYYLFAINYSPSRTPTQQHPLITVTKSTDIFMNEQLKYTEDIIGRRQEPISFVIEAVNQQALISLLQTQGWHLAEDANITSFSHTIKALATDKTYASAPVYPSFWNTRIQDMAFRKLSIPDIASNVHHLKIWKTNYQINNNNIYVAMANTDIGVKWGIIPVIDPDLNSAREAVYQTLLRTDKIRLSQKIQIRKAELGYHFTGGAFFSDGYIYELSLQSP